MRREQPHADDEGMGVTRRMMGRARNFGKLRLGIVVVLVLVLLLVSWSEREKDKVSLSLSLFI